MKYLVVSDIHGSLFYANKIKEIMEKENIDKILEKAKTFKPNKYKSNTENMIKLVEKLINEK